MKLRLEGLDRIHSVSENEMRNQLRENQDRNIMDTSIPDQLFTHVDTVGDKLEVTGGDEDFYFKVKSHGSGASVYMKRSKAAELYIALGACLLREAGA